MNARITLEDITVDVVRKDIRNINLSVRPPAGSVRISAPLRTNTKTIREFAASKLDWIRRQQQKIRARHRGDSRDYVDDEIHFLWGEAYRLKVEERVARPTVDIRSDTIVLCVRPGAGGTKRQSLLDNWYRKQLTAAVPPLISKWEQRMGVAVSRFAVRRMRSRWGSCTPGARTIRLSTELAKRPLEYLEYVLVHEMVHLMEPSHNHRFKALMDKFLPEWRARRDDLNRYTIPQVRTS